ncbi:MAG TPA: hypothetical protein VKU42_02090, partial [Candidatus Angelobacter sp.]|nr:hypothetical protein [Candidatus Angelobacter sp.]
APAGLLVVAAGAFAFASVDDGVVLAEVEALWSDVAGGFTGALALSEDAPAGLLVVAAGAFAFASLDDAAAPAAAPVVAAAAFASVGAALEAWLLVQESEIMFTELTCREPSLPRVPCTWT